MSEKQYIEREAAIAIIEERQKALCPLGRYSRHELYGRDRDAWDNWDEIIDVLDNLPAAPVREVRKGYWIGTEYDGYADGAPVYDKWECSECGDEQDGEDIPDRFDWCPSCGADMRDPVADIDVGRKEEGEAT